MSKDTPTHFLEEIIARDVADGKYGGRVLTRFPPEPNGYLHIGHAKSICLNFGLAETFGGSTNLRFDDTNPVTEETEYVDSIKADIRWLGFTWAGEHFASDYFETLYGYAEQLIGKGLAYVDDSTSEEIAAMKGTPTVPGTDSPYRSRSADENLDLFRRMRAGEFADGAKVLRARIDMGAPNMHLRDPILYRIKKARHHRTGDAWCIYPMYDFAHGQSDSIERITHSICTLEFEVHRPLYDWFIEHLGIFPSRQYEFARLNLNYTVMSKRKLLELVRNKHVGGWDDPRMPTLSGMRRRGFTPASIRRFCDMIGVARREHVIDVGQLEFCIREDLNKHARRAMVVADPLKVVLTNYPEGQTEMLPTENNPEADDKGGTRELPFGRELWIERDDFQENPEKKFFRLTPGQHVRLKSAYIIRCDAVVHGDDGTPSEVHCTYVPESKSGHDTSGIKTRAVIHWVSAAQAVPVELRLYDRLFLVEDPLDGEKEFTEYLNPDSLRIVDTARGEPMLGDAAPGTHFQFLRNGYFCADKPAGGKPVFNRTVQLKDTWSKQKNA